MNVNELISGHAGSGLRAHRTASLQNSCRWVKLVVGYMDFQAYMSAHQCWRTTGNMALWIKAVIPAVIILSLIINILNIFKGSYGCSLKYYASKIAMCLNCQQVILYHWLEILRLFVVVCLVSVVAAEELQWTCRCHLAESKIHLHHRTQLQVANII